MDSLLPARIEKSGNYAANIAVEDNRQTLDL
jgi:hypothetical protein